MMVCYNGEWLPKIPFDANYPYCFIYRNPDLSEYKCRCCLSKNRYFYRQIDQTLQPGSNTVINYWIRESIPTNTSAWERRDTTAYYYNNADNMLWSDYDVAIDSPNGTDIWRVKSPVPISHDISLVQQGNTRILADQLTLSVDIENCTIGNTLIVAYAIRGEDNIATLSSGWMMLGGGNNASNVTNYYQRIFFAYKQVESETEYLSITQNTGALLYVVYGEFANVKTIVMRDDLAQKSTVNHTVNGSKQDADSVMLYAVTAAYYGTGRQQSVSPTDLEKIVGDASYERLAAWFDGGAGAVDHTFVTNRATGSGDTYDAILECVQFIPYDRRYLIRSGGIYYTIVDGELTPLSDAEETEAFFLTNGLTEQPEGSALIDLENPEVLLWSNHPQRTLSMTGIVSGVPLPQILYSPDYDTTDPTILGIESVTVDASSDTLFAVSFDEGGSWHMYTGTAWAALSETDTGMSAEVMAGISPEAWNSVAVTGTIRFRVTLPNRDSYIGELIIDYLN